jgi:hypothetical protein
MVVFSLAAFLLVEASVAVKVIWTATWTRPTVSTDAEVGEWVGSTLFRAIIESAKAR